MSTGATVTHDHPSDGTSVTGLPPDHEGLVPPRASAGQQPSWIRMGWGWTPSASSATPDRIAPSELYGLTLFTSLAFAFRA